MSSTYKWKQCHNAFQCHPHISGNNVIIMTLVPHIAHKRTSQPKSITYKQNGLSTHSRRKTILEKK